MDKIPAEVIGRAVQDTEFRRQLLADPRGTAAAAGFELDHEHIEALQNLDPETIEAALGEMIGDLDPTKYG